MPLEHPLGAILSSKELRVGQRIYAVNAEVSPFMKVIVNNVWSDRFSATEIAGHGWSFHFSQWHLDGHTGLNHCYVFANYWFALAYAAKGWQRRSAA